MQSKAARTGGSDSPGNQDELGGLPRETFLLPPEAGTDAGTEAGTAAGVDAAEGAEVAAGAAGDDGAEGEVGVDEDSGTVAGTEPVCEGTVCAGAVCPVPADSSAAADRTQKTASSEIAAAASDTKVMDLFIKIGIVARSERIWQKHAGLVTAGETHLTMLIDKNIENNNGGLTLKAGKHIPCIRFGDRAIAEEILEQELAPPIVGLPSVKTSGSGFLAVLQDALAQTNLSCLFLLSLAALLSSVADRLLQLKLGSIAVFLSPGGENPGAGVTYMLLPMALLLVPITLFFNDPTRRLRYLQATMLLKGLMALAFSLDITREFLSLGSERVGYSLSLIFLAGEWTVICMVVYLSQRAPRPLIYLSVLGAAYFCGQTLALALAPYLVSQPFTNTFAALTAVLYLLAYYAAKRCQHRKLTYSGLSEAVDIEYEKQTRSGTLRLLAATVILYTPLYTPLMITLFFALLGYQAGTLTFADLAAKGCASFAVGASASIFLHHIASRRRVLQVVAAVTIVLAACGALTYSYDTGHFTLMAVTGLAGFITPDWENHLLSVLSTKTLAPFLAARNTIVLIAIALLSPPVERTLAAVSALYVLKELNILVLACAFLAVFLAPLLLARPRHYARPEQLSPERVALKC
ncbi:MAG: hypothetical protein JSS83_26675 [Cyanobacteria bacterium SZAS LIN-3]|nr:hypothetical protein [Cyanobacteria bacterium SZAS LIN-3]